jgi:hypothetical protein
VRGPADDVAVYGRDLLLAVMRVPRGQRGRRFRWPRALQAWSILHVAQSMIGVGAVAHLQNCSCYVSATADGALSPLDEDRLKGRPRPDFTSAGLSRLPWALKPERPTRRSGNQRHRRRGEVSSERDWGTSKDSNCIR